MNKQIMNTINIEKRICLHSKYLDSNIKKHLLNKLKELSEGSCSKDHGYIINIKQIIDIIDHEIGRSNTDNIFNIKFEADVLKPEPNCELSGKVCMIYKDGIFINIMDKQKMLIPKNNLQDYTYDENQKIYYNDDKTIKVGDEITGIVTATRYINENYSCFGSIV